MAELDMAGEWYLDRRRGELYFWPPDTLNDGEIEISIAETLLNIEYSQNVTVRDMFIEKPAVMRLRSGKAEMSYWSGSRFAMQVIALWSLWEVLAVVCVTA
ncbi:hypothetical protein AWV79_33650 [Cupriavidus sp. UYMMa02A]|nr:hypothetical protein AWV79_33650 [Cupriavidus sp. UYMMa02A]